MNMNNRSENNPSVIDELRKKGKHDAVSGGSADNFTPHAQAASFGSHDTKRGSNEPLYEQVGVATTCRSFEEYCHMFMLEDELPNPGAAILDVAAGASSFTAELCERGYTAVACDPRYALDPDAMQAYGLHELEQATQKLAAKEHAFDWKVYGSLQAHDDIRHQSLEKFCRHYRQSYSNSLYVTASLPSLPFTDEQFDLVVCNHFLFLYGEQFDYPFHLQALIELVRVVKPGGRVLIYPLVGLRNELYPHLDQLQKDLAVTGVEVTLRTTSFRFLPAADRFLQIKKIT